MNSYLLTLVLKSDQTDAARKELLDDVEKKLKIEKGKLKLDSWGIRDLAYPIKRQTKGFYAHFEFETDAKTAKGLDNILRVEEDVIRYLLLRADERLVKPVKTKTEPKAKVEEK